MSKLPFLLMSLLLPVLLIGSPVDSTAAAKDSIIIIVPIPEVGSIAPFSGAQTVIPEREIIYRDYRSLYDILAAQPGVFVRDLASAGQPDQLVINGIDGMNIAIFVDGVPYNDYYTGTVNLWQLPVDAVDRVEVMTGAEALFYDGHSAGGAINIITKEYRNNRAVTRWRYSQGVSGYSQTDAMFAQNIRSGMNLSLGLSHYGFGSGKSSAGYRARFYNSNTDSWMFRSKLRYDVSNMLNLSLAYTYDRSWTGLHGGVDYGNTASIFDGLNADVRNLESYEKNYNSHASFTAAFFPFEDSTFAATMTFYGADRLREYRDEENRGTLRNGVYTSRNGIFTARDFSSAQRGAKIQIVSGLPGIHLLTYADMQRVRQRDIITVGAKADLLPGSFLTVTPFAAARDMQNQFTVYGGVTGTLRVIPSVELYGTMTDAVLHDAPPSSVDNAANFSYQERTKETFTLLEAGLRLTGTGDITGGVMVRRSTEHHPVIFDTVASATTPLNNAYYFPENMKTDVVTAHLHVKMWGDFHAEGQGTYLLQPSRTRLGIAMTLYPDIVMSGSLYFQGLLAKGALDLRAGVRGNFYSKQTGMAPYDEFGVWIPSTELKYGPAGTMDLFAVGKIGDAYVHIIWENVTGSQYLLAPVYPMYDQNIRFGVSWEFLD